MHVGAGVADGRPVLPGDLLTVPCEELAVVTELSLVDDSEQPFD